MSARQLNDRSSEEWAKFLHDYAYDRFAQGNVPHPPPIPNGLLGFGDQPTFDCPLYSAVGITPEIAGRVRDFYAHHGYLPPPRAPLEPLREQCIHEYDLYSEQQAKNIQAATALMQAFFGGICGFTLFRNNVQELVTLAGPTEAAAELGLYTGMRLLPEVTLCGHSILSLNRTLFIQDLSSEWRFKKNPFAIPQKGIKSYIGSPISLNVDPSSSTEEGVVGIGVFNQFYVDEVIPELNSDQEKVIRNVSSMLETQLRATWAGRGRTREARARRGVSDLLEDILVAPKDDTKQTMSKEKRGWEKDAHEAIRRMKTVMEGMDSAMTIDLSLLQALRRSTQLAYALDSSHEYNVRVITQDPPSPTPFDYKALGSAVTALVNTFDLSIRTKCYTADTQSGMESFLPHATTSHIVAPFFSGDQPLFLIVVGTSLRERHFDKSDSNFVRSIGVVLLAKLLQSRVIEADRAKTVFLSSISHELRTPMHGILSGLQLLRDAIKTSDMEQAEQLLAVIESSGYMLQHILNDVLDFGTITKDDSSPRDSSRAATTLIDLRLAASSVARTCASRLLDNNSTVKMLFEYEERDWRANIDAAGFQRVLLNGLTNAVKFTRRGNVTLSLSTDPSNTSLTCKVIDTGIGIDPEFSPKLFEPFTKADSFSQGSGLGLFITQSLASRMNGSVTLAAGQKGGTIFTFTCPVDLIGERGDPRVSQYKLTSEITSDTDSTNGNLFAESIGPAPASGAHGSNELRVLVVDDNVISRKILITLFQQMSRHNSITVVEAKDGVEALYVFRETRPHLVLTDVSMPRMDGVTAAGEMRAIEREWGSKPSRIYAITGLGSSDQRMTTEAMQGTAELDGWLIKGKDQMSKVKEIVSEVQRTL